MASFDSRGGRRPNARGRSTRRARGRRGSARRGNVMGRARGVLRQFRRASTLAVAVTALLVLILDPAYGADTAVTATAEAPAGLAVATETDEAEVGAASAAEAAEEAVGAIRVIAEGFVRSLPRVGVALAVLFVAWGLARVTRAVLTRVTRGWQRSQAAAALAGIAVWLVAIGLAASALTGDLRALIGSLGLIGLALSWALQTPIESFTGWLLNSFQSYYRVGDRVAVGDVFGDVVKIDFLTTTVWEIGSPQRLGFVPAEQPTGRLVTFPNNEILAGSIVNLTRDFPFVWDELAVQVANESDLRFALQLLQRVASELLGERMQEPALAYAAHLRRAGLEETVAPEPQVFASTAESGTDLSIRYLVGARERRRWKSELVLRVAEEMARPEVAAKVLPVYPRRQIQRVGADGVAQSWPAPEPGGP